MFHATLGPSGPRRSRRLLLAALPLLLSGCHGLTEQQEQMLVIHQHNSKLYYDEGDLARAEDQARRGLELDPDDKSLNLVLAYVLLRRGRLDTLDESDKVLRKLDRKDFRVVLAQGVVAATRHRLMREENAEDQRRERPERHGPRELSRVRNSARERLERAFDLESDCTEAVFQLSLLDLEEQDLEAFAEHAQPAIELVDSSIRIKRKALERLENAEQRRITLRDLDVELGRARQLLQLRATLAFQAGDAASSLKDLDRMADLGAMQREDYYDRARVLSDLGDLERAVKDYEQFLELSPPRPDAQIEKAIESVNRLRALLAERRVSGSGDDGSSL